MSGCSYKNRTDYIFAVTAPYFTDNEFLINVLKKKEMSVVGWAFARQSGEQTSYVNVSDHFGLEPTIEIRER